MDDIARLQRIPNRPRCMVQFSGPRTLLRLDGPFGMLINPPPFYPNTRFAIRVHNRLGASVVKAFSKLCDKQFGPAIVSGRNCNEGRGDECNFQLEPNSFASNCSAGGGSTLFEGRGIKRACAARLRNLKGARRLLLCRRQSRDELLCRCWCLYLTIKDALVLNYLSGGIELACRISGPGCPCKQGNECC